MSQITYEGNINIHAGHCNAANATHSNQRARVVYACFLCVCVCVRVCVVLHLASTPMI